MARPTTHADLSSIHTDPHVFVHIDPQFLTTDIAVGSAILALIDVAQKAELLNVSTDGAYIVSIDRSVEELDRALKHAQAAWDRDEVELQKVYDGEEVPSWRRFSLEQHAKAEGHDPIDWAEYDEHRAKVEAANA
ncbi:hypothetical protein SEA_VALENTINIPUFF_36 [Microbacterium phage ValentiniPuff]|uniref:Uncharacterized protein n=1 Tax=Microbacterium phage ValentiniPuff TaxID=2315705 RepID=A0A386KSM8_9CAUD|nr:hypothetical protein SEA_VALENTINIPUFF_36 [Microbacterium phage ValentiniPuff]